MAIIRRIGEYSRRAWLVGAFLACAFLFGGGEAKNPLAEMSLQVIFACAAIAWFWLVPKESPADRSQRLVWILAGVVLAVPMLQLVPLPPSIWQSLPGREAMIASLQLVGAEQTWRPISAVPADTQRSILALIPAVGTMIAVSRLDLHDRRMVLLVVQAMALLTVVLGLAQLAAPDGSLNFHSKIHAGWITGFQSNRNHAADVLLAGLIAVVSVAQIAALREGMRLPRGLTPRTVRALTIAMALLLLTAIVMTGSRTGIALALVVLAAAAFMGSIGAEDDKRTALRRFGPAIVLLGAAALFAVVVATGEGTAVGRVLDRFGQFEDNREKLWEDAAFAWKQYWPVGIGAGGFIAAMFPAERLEFLDASYPNQAHNDYLEIGIEAGAAAYLALLAVFVCIAMLVIRHWRRAVSKEARVQIIFGATLIILFCLHSVVDYPLRSMSLSCLAGAACGMLSRTSARQAPQRSESSKGH